MVLARERGKIRSATQGPGSRSADRGSRGRNDRAAKEQGIPGRSGRSSMARTRSSTSRESRARSIPLDLVKNKSSSRRPGASRRAGFPGECHPIGHETKASSPRAPAPTGRLGSMPGGFTERASPCARRGWRPGPCRTTPRCGGGRRPRCDGRTSPARSPAPNWRIGIREGPDRAASDEASPASAVHCRQQMITGELN